jgi:hypothetical protein
MPRGSELCWAPTPPASSGGEMAPEREAETHDDKGSRSPRRVRHRRPDSAGTRIPLAGDDKRRPFVRCSLANMATHSFLTAALVAITTLAARPVNAQEEQKSAGVPDAAAQGRTVIVPARPGETPRSPIYVKAVDAEDSAKSVADQIKAGQLLRYGVSLGAAVQFHTGTSANEGGDSGATINPAGGALVYLAVFPWYWGGGDDEQDLYCASPSSENQDAADAAAVARARKQNPRIEALVAKLVETDTTSKKPYELCREAKDCYDDVKAEIGWKLGVKGGCAFHKFGLYFGYPLSVTKMNVRLAGVERARDMTGIFSGGLVFAPNYYLQFIAGVTLLNAQRSDDGTAVVIAVPSLGVGTTLDVFAAVAK